MTVDPRTPVIVGVAQINDDSGLAPEPVDMLVDVARTAAADTGSPRILESVQAIRVVRILSRRYRDAALLVAQRLGVSPGETATTESGGHVPQFLVQRTAHDIWRGDLDVALLGGAENSRSHLERKRRGEKSPGTLQPDRVDFASVIGDPMTMNHPAEVAVGLRDPLQAYPMFENALRAAAGHGINEHAVVISELWARFAAVAQANPHAANRTAPSAQDIRTPGPGNRMVATPYTKLLCSNERVDQAAAVIMCSAERARALGIPQDRWVFLHGAGEVEDVQMSHRLDFASSASLRGAARTATAQAGVGVDDLDFVDLYSCFPSAVEVAARELGLSLDRELTVTGGLTFAGGPWSNYVTHAIATLIGKLRDQPDAYGLCAANGGLLTRHAVGIYSTRPPRSPAAYATRTPVEHCAPQRELAADFEGPARIETYTVTNARDGSPERAYFACLTSDGHRAWASSADADTLSAAGTDDLCGRATTVRALTLRS